MPRGLIGCQPLRLAHAQPTTARVTAELSDTTSVGTTAGTQRDAMSRVAPAKEEKTTSQVQTSRSPGRGWITISTPTKPTAIAVQRRQPTVSFSSSTARAARNNGVERLI